MPNSGSNTLETTCSVQSAPASARFDRWLAANAVALRAQRAMAFARQGEDLHPLSSWPQDSDLTAELEAVAVQALHDGVHVKRVASNSVEVVLGLCVRIAGRPGVIVFELTATAEQSDRDLVSRVQSVVLRRSEDAMATVEPLPVAQVQSAQTESSTQAQDLQALINQQGTALDVIAAMLDHAAVDQSARAFVDALATRFSCKRVTLGSKRFSKVLINAVSGTADFDVRSAVMSSMALALDETVTLQSVVALPAIDATQPLPVRHREFATCVKTPALVSLPMVESGRVIGALMLERDRVFDAAEIERLKQLVVLSAPVFSLKQLAAAGPLRKLVHATHGILARLVGPEQMLAKAVAAGLLAVVIWSSQYQQTFSIDADAAIEPSVMRAVVAGSSSYIAQVEKRAGDVVYQGDVLARLDVEDLQLERLKWESEREKTLKEQRATLAQRDRTRIRILAAKSAQAQTQIDFLDAQIARAVLRAPIDGVVVAGDLSEALGSPVERGQLLFEVASLRDYRLILNVDEADVGEIAEGYTGRLRLRSSPHKTYEFVVIGITPVSEASDGENRFRVEADLKDAPNTLRPGMGGIGKIDAGERAIGWVWTRSFVRWARLALWRLGWLA